MAELLLGVDGGGSKTVALVADRSGMLLGRGEAASSNYQSVGFAAAAAAIEAATRQALEEAGLDGATSLAAACFGLAGAARPADQARFEAWLIEQEQIRRWRIVNDAELVLAAGTPEGWGVALICGTGSICYARNPDGRSARAGAGATCWATRAVATMWGYRRCAWQRKPPTGVPGPTPSCGRSSTAGSLGSRRI